MEKLNFPIIRDKASSKKQLSMDDYVKFVNLNLKYTVDRKAIKKQKRLLACNKPFSLV
ncbi:MAG: hypothetical protein ABH815_03685 [Candidatus Omnitrophota bacterium]